MKGNRRRATNAIEVDFLARLIMLVCFLGLAGLFFVYLKNQQHAVGNQSRILEAEIRETEAKTAMC